MRRIGAFVIAAALGACAAGGESVTVAPVASAAPPVNWKIERKLDRVTGRPAATAWLTLTSVSLITGEIRTGEMQLLCFKRQPVVRFAFNYKIGSNRSASLAYRFDENPGHDAMVRFLQDFKTVVIEDKAEVARFVAELKSAGTLFVRIESLNAGRTTIELGVHGAAAAISEALAECPAAPDPQRNAGLSAAAG